MNEIYIYSFASVFLVSLVSLIGIFTLSFNERLLRKSIFIFVSLAVGALFGDALIHLIPEALEEGSSTEMISLFILFGIVSFFVLEKFLHWHHHSHIDECHSEEQLVDELNSQKIKPLGFLVLTSDSVHNFIDGIIIGASYLISIEVGIATTITVILHEIPQEISDFGILLHAGFSKTRAMLLNFATALFAVIGTVLVFVLENITTELIPAITAFAAGNFLYIAGSDLVPELHKTSNIKRSLLQFSVMIIGIGIMFALTLFE